MYPVKFLHSSNELSIGTVYIFFINSMSEAITSFKGNIDKPVMLISIYTEQLPQKGHDEYQQKNYQ